MRSVYDCRLQSERWHFCKTYSLGCCFLALSSSGSSFLQGLMLRLQLRFTASIHSFDSQLQDCLGWSPWHIITSLTRRFRDHFVHRMLPLLSRPPLSYQLSWLLTLAIPIRSLELNIMLLLTLVQTFISYLGAVHCWFSEHMLCYFTLLSQLHPYQWTSSSCSSSAIITLVGSLTHGPSRSIAIMTSIGYLVTCFGMEACVLSPTSRLLL